MFGGRSEGFLNVQYQWETAPAMVTSPSAETMPILQRKMKMLYHCRARCRVRGPYLRRPPVSTPAAVVSNVKPANSEVVDTEQVLCVSPARNHMESEPGFGFREKSMKR